MSSRGLVVVVDPPVPLPRCRIRPSRRPTGRRGCRQSCVHAADPGGDRVFTITRTGSGSMKDTIHDIWVEPVPRAGAGRGIHAHRDAHRGGGAGPDRGGRWGRSSRRRAGRSRRASCERFSAYANLIKARLATTSPHEPRRVHCHPQRVRRMRDGDGIVHVLPPSSPTSMRCRCRRRPAGAAAPDR